VDEARMESLYELEVAFRNMPTSGACEPVLLDGLLRNLLADITGNTHRAEFCIDKLYPPAGQGLKLGLLELRAFEMAPHLRMNLLQMLVVRAAASAFWKQPYTRSLVRWGTQLNDRFMLPSVVRADLKEVLDHFRSAGYAFEDSWFDAHYNFRFPLIGTLDSGPVRMELRKALEPWHVLAEESVSGGTVRSVDSSLERVEVALKGAFDPARYAVLCNGRRLPLQKGTGEGEFYAGVRFRARNLRATLLPMVPVHAPLHFDLVDLWCGSSLGQCVYHVNCPPGKLYSGLPADAQEAAERRSERFVIVRTNAVPVAIPAEEVNPFFASTLDLRIPPAGA